jgi:pyridoxine 5-phosphate synthase
MARLSVNLNKVALLRNSRRTGVPDLLSFPARVKAGGGLGITVHPRPDERHIRRSDVPALAMVIAAWRPGFEYNIEGNPTPGFLDLVAPVRPEQCTLVPDAATAFTSDKGWNLDAAEIAALAQPIKRMKSFGSRVILFVDPDPAIAARAADAGADGIEIYTGCYAAAHREGKAELLLDAISKLGSNAKQCGLIVNAGHDLNLENIPGLMSVLPHLHEASIGHELTADGLIMGFDRAVRLYAQALK